MMTRKSGSLSFTNQKNAFTIKAIFGADVKTGCSNTRLDSHTTTSSEGEERVNVPEKTPTKVGLAKVPKAPGEESESKNIEVHVDWLQFSGEIINHANEIVTYEDGDEDKFIDRGEEVDFEREQLLKFIELATGEEIVRNKTQGLLIAPGVYYQHTGRSSKGIKVAWNSCNRKVYIVIPGKVLSAMEVPQVWEMAKYIVNNYQHLHCTRIDIAIDDYGKRLDPNLICAALNDGNYSKFRDKDMKTKFNGDWTVRLGHIESDRSTVIYNKEAESKGKIKAYRIEGRFRHKVAHKVLQGWLAIDYEQTCTTYIDKVGARRIKSDEDWEKESCNYLIGSVIGSFDFIDRQSKPNEKNLKRIPRLDWWQAFIDVLDCPDEIYHTRPVIVPTLERSTKWLKGQVSRAMYCVLAAFGDDAKDWFLNLMESAGGSLNEGHIQRLKQYTREYQIFKGQYDFCVASPV